MLELYMRIRKRREELNLSQEELAQKMGYKSRSSINKIEMGENDIPQSKIEQFARALNTTPAYLMGWTDDPDPKQKSPAEAEDRALIYAAANTGIVDLDAAAQLAAMSMSAAARKVAIAYDKADIGTQASVRKLLDVEG